MSAIQRKLDSLPLGRSPYGGWSVRQKYLNDIFDEIELYDPEERNRLSEKYIGKAPADVDTSDTTGGWWSRTGAKTKYNTQRTIDSLRQRLFEQLGDQQYMDMASADIAETDRLLSTIPDDDSFMQDFIVSSPVMLGGFGIGMGLAKGAMVLGAGAKLAGLAGTLGSYAYNIAVSESESFDEAFRDPKVRELAKQIKPDATEDEIEEFIKVSASSAGDLRREAEFKNPINILTSVLEANPAGFLSKFGKSFLYRSATTKLGKAMPNVRDVAVKAGVGASFEGLQEGSQDVTQQAISEWTRKKLERQALEGVTADNSDTSLAGVIKDIDFGSDIDYGRTGYASALGAFGGSLITGGIAGVQRYRDLPRERIRQEVRDAVESGDMQNLELVREKYPLNSAERIIVESEYEDIQKGVITDYRVDKDKTRYELRRSLAQAFESGEQDIQRWVLEHRGNKLSESVVNDFFAEVDANRAERLRAVAEEIEGVPQATPVGEAYGPTQDFDPIRERQRRREEDAIRQSAEATLQDFPYRTGASTEGTELTPYTGMGSVVVRPQGDMSVPPQAQRAEPQQGQQPTEKSVGDRIQEVQEITADDVNRILEAGRRRREAQQAPEQLPAPVQEQVQDSDVELNRNMLPVDLQEARMIEAELARREQEIAGRAQRRMEADMLRDEYDNNKSFANFVNNLLNERRSSDVRQEDETKKQGRSQEDDGQKADAKEVVKPKLKRKAKPSAETAKPSRTKRKQPSKKTSATAKPAPVQDPVQETAPEVRPLEGPLTERADSLRRNQNISRFDMQRDDDGNITETTFYDNTGAIDKLTRDELEQEGMIRKVAGKESIDLTTKQPAPEPKTEEVKEQDDTERTATKEDTAEKAEEPAPEAKKQDAKPRRARKKDTSTPKEPEAVVEKKVKKKAGKKEEKKEEVKAEEPKAKVPPKVSTRAKKRIVPAKTSERKADPSRLQDTDEQVTQRTTGFTEEGEAEVAVQQVDTQFDETADNRLVAYKDNDGKEQNIFGFTNNKQVSALKNARNDGVVRTVEDIKNLKMQKGTEKRKEDYIAYNPTTGKFADLPPTVAEKIIDYADKELGVRIPVIGIQDEKLEFTYGDEYIGNLFVNYFGANAFTDLARVGDFDAKKYDIIKVASFQRDGQPSISAIRRSDYPIKGAPEFVEFEDMIKDIKNIGVRDAYIDVGSGIMGESAFDKFLPEGLIDRALDPKIDKGVRKLQKDEKGFRTLNIVLTSQDKFQGINNNQPVDVIYKINFKPEGGKAIKTKKLQEFAKALIQPSFRTQATIDVRTLSRAPSQDVGRGISSAQVVQELARFSQRFAGARMLKYKIFDSAGDAQQAGYDIDPRARGAIIDDETVLLISENIADLNTARAVLFHESIGHYGMKQFLGERGFNQLLDEIISKRKLDVRRKAKELGVDERIATEELIAEIAEGRANQNVAQRILQIIKDFFSRVFGREMSDAEIRNLVIQAEKKFRDDPRVASDPRYDATFTPKPLTEEQASTIFPEANSIRYSLGTSSARLTNKESLNLEVAKEQLSDYMKTQLNGKIIHPFEWDTDSAKNSISRRDMIKASEWSIANRDRLGGWYMLSDGGWRFEIPDFDKDGNPVLQINKNFLVEGLTPEFESVNRKVEDLLQLHRTGEMSKYRDQIDDYETMKFNARDGEFELLEIIRHKELEERFPELMQNHRVVFRSDIEGLGAYNELGQTIIVNPEKVHVGPNSTGKESLRSVILHELTHAIQDMSGFAMGASGRGNYDPFDHKRADALTYRYTEDWQQLNAITDTTGAFKLGDLIYAHFQNALGKKKLGSKVLRDAYDAVLQRNPRFLAYFSTESKFLNETLEDLYNNIERTSEGFNLKINFQKKQTVDFTFDNEIDISNFLQNFFKDVEKSRTDLQSLMPDTFRPFAQYQRNLGEMEARDQQYRFETSNILEINDPKNSPLNFVYENESIKSQDDAILVYMGEQADALMKQYTPEMKQVRYSIPPNPEQPIISRRQQESTAPTWMSEEQKKVFDIPQFGNPLAGKTLRNKFDFLFHDIGMKLRQGIFDRFASLKRLGNKAYILARMSNSSDGALDALFRYGTISLDKDGAITVDPDSKSLVEALSPLGNDLDTFLRWVASQRHRDLKNDPKMPRDALKFLSDEELEVALTFNQGQTVNALTGESVSREKLFDDVYKDFKAIQNSVTEIAKKSGLIDEETAKKWEGQFYVPFYRILEEDNQSGAGPRTLDSLVNQKAYEKLKGSDKHLGDLLQNTLMNWNHLISASLKNNASKEAINQMKQIKVPDGRPAIIEGPKEFPSYQMFGMEVKPEGGQIIHVLENGKRQYYYINDPLWLESLQALNQIGRDNPFFTLMRGQKRWFTYAVTFSPEFKIANLIRDSINAIAVTPAGTVNEFKDLNNYNPFANIARGWRGTRKDAKTQAYLTAGGGMFQFGAMNGTDPDVAKRMIQAGINKEFVLDSPEGFANFNGLMKMAFQQGKRLWGAYDKLGNRLENVNRVALYDKLREQGMSHLEASYNARDMMDFSSTGSFGMIQYLASFSPFLNARLQGMYKLGRSATDPEQRMQLIATLGTYVMVSTALYLMFKDDDDFKEREDWDRDSYHWFKFPGSDIAVRIPKAFELGVVATLVERGVEQFVNDEVHGRLFADRLKHALEGTLAFDVRPAIFRPFMDIYANKNPFTGRPIESLSMQNLSPEERRNAYTSEFSTLVSQTAHSLVPWDAVTYSPKQIEYMVNGFGGWIGATVLEGADVLTRVLQGKSATRQGVHWSRLPVVKRFAEDTSRRVYSSFGTQFYYMNREMNRAFNDIRELRELGEIERAQSIQEKKSLMLQYRKGFNRVQRRASEINNEIARITSDPNMDTDLKDMRINRLTQLRNAMFRAVVEQTPSEIRY